MDGERSYLVAKAAAAALDYYGVRAFAELHRAAASMHAKGNIKSASMMLAIVDEAEVQWQVRHRATVNLTSNAAR
jgi:hypothetical protein